jgi:hypothetical protein
MKKLLKDGYDLRIVRSEGPKPEYDDLGLHSRTFEKSSSTMLMFMYANDF